ncbi:MAG: rod shape-determining protein MreC [Bdellovibrionota bacterium]|nr:rod shape-determining protein MreC [Bdellovibrionota bacterium]
MRLIEDKERRQKAVLNILVLLIAFVGVAKRSKTLDETSAFENILIDSFAPLQTSLTSIRTEVASFFDHYVVNINASKKNVSYQKRIDELEGEIAQFQELRRENKRLKDLLQFGTGVDYKKILAQVVAWDASSDFRVIRINKGLADGVTLQSPVITANGLVGYIYRLTDSFADILTVLDNNNRVDGLIQRVRAHGIVEGYNSEKSIMKYVSRAEPIILGDVVITSGLGNIYPKGIRVGKVSRIERESYGITQNVEITPAVDFGRLEEVVILVAEGDEQKKREWEALDQMDEDSEKQARSKR